MELFSIQLRRALRKTGSAGEWSVSFSPGRVLRSDTHLTPTDLVHRAHERSEAETPAFRVFAAIFLDFVMWSGESLVRDVCIALREDETATKFVAGSQSSPHESANGNRDRDRC